MCFVCVCVFVWLGIITSGGFSSICHFLHCRSSAVLQTVPHHNGAARLIKHILPLDFGNSWSFNSDCDAACRDCHFWWGQSSSGDVVFLGTTHCMQCITLYRNSSYKAFSDPQWEWKCLKFEIAKINPWLSCLSPCILQQGMRNSSIHNFCGDPFLIPILNGLTHRSSERTW